MNEVTGEKIGKAHNKGIWYSTVHLFIVSTDKKTLQQQRCEDIKKVVTYQQEEDLRLN